MDTNEPILTYLIDLVTYLVEAILGLRIILKLFGANPSAPFVEWIYKTSTPLLAPFENMFPSPAIEGGFVLEFSALFAVLVYAIAGTALIRATNYLETGLKRSREDKS